VVTNDDLTTVKSGNRRLPPENAPSRSARASRTILILLAAAAIALLLAYSKTGVGGSRVARPAGAPAPGRTSFLGIDYWYLLFEIGSLVMFVAVWTVAIVQSRRTGRWTPTLVMMAVTTCMVWLDPLMNWVPYASYDPRMFHFDVDLPWIDLAPTVEPWAVIIGYGYFFLIPAWFTLGLYRRAIAPRVAADSWVIRRPLLAILALSFVTCVVWDAVMEMLFVRMGLYSYTQVVPGLSLFTGQRFQYPLVLEAIGFGAVLCPAAPLMWRDATGRTWPEKVAQRFRVFAKRPNLGAFTIALGLMSTIYLAYGLEFAVVRVSGVATETAKPWPMPDTAVYDPQGYYQHSGEPGPFYVGTWGGWEHRSDSVDTPASPSP
jgi:hypothetical protein